MSADTAGRTDAGQEHEASVVAQYGFGSEAANYFGTCTCGWQGPNRSMKSIARLDTETHLRTAANHTRADPATHKEG